MQLRHIASQTPSRDYGELRVYRMINNYFQPLRVW